MSLTVVRRFQATTTQLVAVFLDPRSRATLLRWWQGEVAIPLHAQVHADHMTVLFQPTEQEARALPLGAKMRLRVIGWAADERGQAVRIARRDLPDTNRLPHVTVACAPGVSAFYSNELVARGACQVNGPVLTGTLEAR